MRKSVNRDVKFAAMLWTKLTASCNFFSVKLRPAKYGHWYHLLARYKQHLRRFRWRLKRREISGRAEQLHNFS